MPHIQLDLEFIDHPKTVSVSPLAQLLFIRSLIYCSKHLTDGFLPYGAVSSLTYDLIGYSEPNPTHNGIVGEVTMELLKNELICVNKWWTEANGGFIIHDFLEYQLSRADVEKIKDRNRLNGLKSKGRPRNNPTDNPTDNPEITQNITQKEPRNNPEITQNITQEEPRNNPEITQNITQEEPKANPNITPLTITITSTITSTNKKENTKKDNTSPADKKISAGKVEAVGAETWEAYREAYNRRYKVDPVRNHKVNSMIKEFTEKTLGPVEAPQVAAFYLTCSQPIYINSRHSINLLIRDATGLRTQWATGVKATRTEARGEEKKENITEQLKRRQANKVPIDITPNNEAIEYEERI